MLSASAAPLTAVILRTCMSEVIHVGNWPDQFLFSSADPECIASPGGAPAFLSADVLALRVRSAGLAGEMPVALFIIAQADLDRSNLDVHRAVVPRVSCPRCHDGRRYRHRRRYHSRRRRARLIRPLESFNGGVHLEHLLKRQSAILHRFEPAVAGRPELPDQP